MNPKLRSALVLAAIFLAGATTGGFLALGPLRPLAQPRPPLDNFATRHVKQLTEALALTGKQRVEIDGLVRQTGERLEKARHDAREQTVGLIGELNERIKAALTPEQIPKFEAFQKAQSQRWRDMERMRRGRRDRNDGRGHPPPQEGVPACPPPPGAPAGLPPPSPGG